MQPSLIIGDLHSKDNNLEVTEQVMDFIDKTCSDRGIQHRVWLGDVFDKKGVLEGNAFNLVANRLGDTYSETLIVGNHDLFNLMDNTRHSLETFNRNPKCNVIDDLQLKNGVYYMPYYHTLTDLRARLSKIPDGSTVFGHFDIISFDYGNGYISKKGLTVEELNRFKAVYSGHYHKYCKRGNITYLGTPRSKDFSEANQEKFIAVYDGDSLELIKTPFNLHKRVDIKAKSDQKVEVFDSEYLRYHVGGTKKEVEEFFQKRPELANKSNVIDKGAGTTYLAVEENLGTIEQFTAWNNQSGTLDDATFEVALEILREVVST